MVFLSLASIAFAVLSIRVQQQRKYGLLFLSAIFAALALLVKPFAIFLLIPLPYLFLLSLGITWVSLFVCIISFAISVVPLFLWREWITRFPEGIPVFTWLFNEGNIRFKGAWFHWRAAVTEWKLVRQGTDADTGEKVAYLELHPLTGRTHQIRVHLKAIHHPVVSDSLYATGKPQALGFVRTALHAHKLAITLPSGAVKEFMAPLPADFLQALEHGMN